MRRFVVNPLALPLEAAEASGNSRRSHGMDQWYRRLFEPSTTA